LPSCIKRISAPVNLVAIQGPDVNDQEPLIEDDDAQLELQLALERYLQSIQVVLIK
jgi:hypothetical protein